MHIPHIDHDRLATAIAISRTWHWLGVIPLGGRVAEPYKTWRITAFGIAEGK